MLLLQIPSFGWHQVIQCPADSALRSVDDLTSLTMPPQQQQQRWVTGDLVQLALDRNSSSSGISSLTLTVNNESSGSATSASDGLTGSISSMISSGSSAGGCGSNGGSSVALPAFEEWCWYLALYRGTQVVAVVLDRNSYAVYTGDTKLKRYLS